MELLISASFIAAFFAGIAALFAPCCITVLLPTYFASIFIILLGLTLVLGFQFSFPALVHPQLKNSGFLSVFGLGIFSGIATTCCAPVLAGVLTLAALPASFLLGGAYTLAYVLGMVIPLFILSMFLDKNK